MRPRSCGLVKSFNLLRSDIFKAGLLKIIDPLGMLGQASESDLIARFQPELAHQPLDLGDIMAVQIEKLNRNLIGSTTVIITVGQSQLLDRFLEWLRHSARIEFQNLVRRVKSRDRFESLHDGGGVSPGVALFIIFERALNRPDQISFRKSAEILGEAGAKRFLGNRCHPRMKAEILSHVNS